MLLALFSSGTSHFMQDIGGGSSPVQVWLAHNFVIIDKRSCELKGSLTLLLKYGVAV